MEEYLTVDHPDAFVDFEARVEELKASVARFHPNWTVLCPKCKGRGGWNLRLNAYPLPKGMEDTAENRNKYVHFRAGCQNCTSWGWVLPDSPDALCIHDYVEQKGTRMFQNIYICSKCNHAIETDSSG